MIVLILTGIHHRSSALPFIVQAGPKRVCVQHVKAAGFCATLASLSADDFVLLQWVERQDCADLPVI